MRTLRFWRYGTTGAVATLVTLFTFTYVFAPSIWTYVAELLWKLA